MEKAENISIQYVASDSIQMQGKKQDINPYLKTGYHIKEERNGYWVLTNANSARTVRLF